MSQDLSTRKPTRLQGYDYSRNGYYFITVCSKDKECLFGQVVGGGAYDAPQMVLSEIGKTVETYLVSTNNIPEITVDKADE